MQYVILTVGCFKSIQEERSEWEQHGVILNFADDVRQAAQMLGQRAYSCAVICSDHFSGDDFNMLREAGAIPILVLPAACEERGLFSCPCPPINYHAAPPQSIHDILYRHVRLANRQPQPLTVIKAGELWFCLERRAVEVREQRIELTAKEFDIFALLIMDQKRVFTFDMIVEAVWRHDTDFYSRKTVSNHIANLNRKLKLAPDVPDYIKSVRGVGYKFEI